MSDRGDSRKPLAQRVEHRQVICLRGLVGLYIWTAFDTLPLHPSVKAVGGHWCVLKQLEKQRISGHAIAMGWFFCKRCRAGFVALAHLAGIVELA